MIWALGAVFACLVGALVGEASARVQNQPQLVIVCERGGVQPNESHIASGSNCVLHDSGASTSAGAISVYNDDGAAP